MPREGEKPVWQLVGEELSATGVLGFTQQADCPLPEATQKSPGGEWIIKRQTGFQQGPAPQVPRGGGGEEVLKWVPGQASSSCDEMRD